MTDHSNVRILDALRGLAALAVVLFHFGAAVLPSITPNALSEVLRPGKLGLQVFFVISGFVIPYAMYRAGYTWAGFGRFMARRWVRLAPPAYAAACLMILYHALAEWSTGHPVAGAAYPGLTLPAILDNLFFTVGIFDPPGADSGGEWYNFVYWSLAVEFEFYILIALLFPLLMDARRKWVSPVIMFALLVFSQWHSLAFFRYTVYFLLGILVFQRQTGLLGNRQLALSALICCAFGVADGYAVETIVSATTAWLILMAPSRIPGVLLWLGTISYSLYILHPPVGYFLDSIGKRVTDLHTQPAGKILLLLLYTGIAIGLAALFHRFVEKPFLEFSKTVGKRTARPTVLTAK